jgi:hypothetical protein
MILLIVYAEIITLSEYLKIIILEIKDGSYKLSCPDLF